MIIPFMLLIAALILGFLIALGWALVRWQGKWRWLALAPLLLVSFVVLRIIVDTSADPTSHNLWPFEVFGVTVVLDHLPGQDFNRRVLLIHEGRLYHFFFTPVDPSVEDVYQQMEAFYRTITESFRLIPVVPGAPLEVGP